MAKLSTKKDALVPGLIPGLTGRLISWGTGVCGWTGVAPCPPARGLPAPGRTVRSVV